jgi:hypothetical protein
METTESDPLHCRECETALLPDRVIPLKNELRVLYGEAFAHFK